MLSGVGTCRVPIGTGHMNSSLGFKGLFSLGTQWLKVIYNRSHDVRLLLHQEFSDNEFLPCEGV